MNPLLAKAIAAQRTIKDGGSPDNLEAEIIDLALNRLIREARVPFQRFRDHFIIGTERWDILDGLDYYRAILLHRKSDSWYPESDMSEISVFAVYTSAQVQPPDPNVFDEDRGKEIDYAYDLLSRGEKDELGRELPDRAHIGPSAASSYQKILEEAPPDWRMNAIGTVQANLRKYAKEIDSNDSVLRLEQKDELEAYLREHAKSKTGDIPDGELEAVLKAYLSTQYYGGKPRAIPGPKQMICDRVRKSCEYAIEKLMKGNQMSQEIARHLNEHVVVGQTCEYKGDLKWNF